MVVLAGDLQAEWNTVRRLWLLNVEQRKILQNFTIDVTAANGDVTLICPVREEVSQAIAHLNTICQAFPDHDSISVFLAHPKGYTLVRRISCRRQ